MHVYGMVANHIALSGANILPGSDLTCYYTTRLWTPNHNAPEEVGITRRYLP
jgi:hypothetical protein